MEDSIFSLSNQLCSEMSKLDGKADPSFQEFVQHIERDKERRNRFRRNKEKLFSILLKKRVINVPSVYKMSTTDKIAAHAYEMAGRNELENSRLLQQNYEQLEVSPDIEKVLTFLLELRDTGQKEKRSNLVMMGDGIEDYNNVENLEVFPFGIKSSLKPLTVYKNYPNDIFCVDEESFPKCKLKIYSKTSFMFNDDSEDMELFNLEPKLGIDTDIGSIYSNNSQVVKCDLLDQDEGYISPVPQEDPTEIWEKIWEVEIPRRRTWESLGNKIVEKELPYLSEVGPDAVHHAWTIVTKNLCLIDPTLKILPLVTISTSRLTADVGYLLAGIPSTTFSFCSSSSSFHLVPGTCLLGVSPECLASVSAEYIQSGNIAKRLDEFCAENGYLGNVFEGFKNGIRSFLRVYTNAVVTLSIKFSTNLSELEQVLRPLTRQISFLGAVCELKIDCRNSLPSGVSLLSKLLDVSVHVSNKVVHLLLVALLTASASPYFRFLKSWLFAGEVDGCPGEFGLEIESRFINARDSSYWDSAYNLIPIEGSSFLLDIQQKVHLTGKSLALLKLICPDHYLAGKFRHLQPNMKLAIAANDQVDLKESCKKYEDEMVVIAKQLTDNLAEMKAKEEAARIEKVQAIHKRNKEVEMRIKEQEDLRKEEKKRKQVEQYEDFQNQIKLTKERKLREKEEKIEEDKKVEKEAQRMEDDLKKREEEDRNRIQEFYAKLNAEAELRERRAEWRMKRSDPSLKSKRVVLQRDISKTIENMMRVLKSPLKPKVGGIGDSEVGVSDVGNVNYPKLKFDNDEMGNVIVMVEDQEGNLISECFEGFNDLSQEVQNELKNDNFDSLPDETKEQICKSIVDKSSNETVYEEKGEDSPFGPIHTRFQNKAMILGSNIPMHYEELDTPRKKSVDHDDNGNPYDNTDGTPRKRSGNSQPIERLLYPHRYYQDKKDTFTPTKTELVLSHYDKPTPYAKKFPIIQSSTFHEIGGPSPDSPPADGQAFAPLTLILQNSILIPLRVQARLVNSALLDHLLVDRQLVDHFHALRKYLLLADGEFGRQLVLSLCHLGQTIDQPTQLAGQLHSHLWAGAPPPHLLSPASLNRVLDSALAGSVSGSSDPLASHLTFLLDQVACTRTLGIPGLSLTYQAGWPANIVLTPDTVAKYSTILDFMIELRLAMVALELDWANENLVLRRDKKTDKQVLHKINLMRHEMMNFLRNLHAYVSCQVLEVSWLEFQENLSNKVTCLDDLISLHEKYLQRALFRCLLNSKAAPVMKIITDIFSSITRFSGMVGARFSGDSTENWLNIQKQYGVFRQYSRFLYSVVSKLSARGYQPHLQDLLLRLNFNGFYDQTN